MDTAQREEACLACARTRILGTGVLGTGAGKIEYKCNKHRG